VAAQRGVGQVGTVTVVDHDPNGPVNHRQFIQADRPRDRGGRRKVGIEHDRSMPVTPVTVLCFAV
jgi:hypothetical protein